jgi:hypothetical protein
MRKNANALALLILLLFAFPAATAFCCCVSGNAADSMQKSSHANCPDSHPGSSAPKPSDCQAQTLNVLERGTVFSAKAPAVRPAKLAIETNERHAFKPHFEAFLELGQPGPRLAAHPQYLEVLRI